MIAVKRLRSSQIESQEENKGPSVKYTRLINREAVLIDRSYVSENKYFASFAVTDCEIIAMRIIWRFFRNRRSPAMEADAVNGCVAVRSEPCLGKCALFIRARTAL